MTVTTTATDVIYTEDGSTLQFDFNTFTIFEQTDIVVTSIIISTGLPNPNYNGSSNAGELVLNTDYSVTINADGTGYITKSVALSNLYELVIQRVLPISQQISLVDNVGTDAATYEEGYDRLTMIAQQLQAQIDRSILQPITVDTPIAFPTPVASTYLGFDGTGKLTTLSSISTVTLTPISPSVALNIAQVNSAGTNLQYVSLGSLLAGLTTPNSISGAVLFNLNLIPSGAGVIPIANIPSITNAKLAAGVGTGANNIVALNGSSQLPAVSGVNLTNVHAAVNANLSGNQLGAWTSISTGTIYQAATDGFVLCVIDTGNTSTAYSAILTDSSSSPSTERSRVASDSSVSGPNGIEATLFSPIRKGDYYQISVTGTAFVVSGPFFIASGS